MRPLLSTLARANVIGLRIPVQVKDVVRQGFTTVIGKVRVSEIEVEGDSTKSVTVCTPT